jgi:hypothetical protein
MFDFLALLWAKANDVWDWFSDTYPDKANVVRNIFTWMVREVSEAYHGAIAWANWVKDYAIAFALTKYGEATAFTEYWAHRLEDYINGKTEAIKTWFQYWIDTLKSYAVERKNEAIAWAQWKIDEKITWVQSRLDYVLQRAVDYARPVVSFKTWLSDTATLLSTETLADILTFFNAGKQELLLLAQDPSAYVVGIIKPYFRSLITYAIAYGLGTTDRDLPPWPSLSDLRD